MTDDGARRRRRLAAILMADVVGFSRMMGRDEDTTTDRILRFHRVVLEIVEKHGGRVVSTAGDSVFGDFDSVVDALDAGRAIQERLVEANQSLAEDEQIRTRIGLHLGDVIVEEYNVFGDGVNIASRLEQLADPGGILMSEAVYQQVRGRTDLPLEDMGVQQLKNIEEPIRLYRVSPAAFGDEDVAIAPASTDGSEVVRPAAIAEAVAMALDEAEGVVDKQEIRNALRGAVLRGASGANRSVREEVLGRDDAVHAILRFDYLVVIALGVLGILARTSGWSGSGWYPFLGSILLGRGLGSMVRDLSGRRGVDTLLVAVGFGIGTWFFGNTVARVFGWVFSASLLGKALRRLRE